MTKRLLPLLLLPVLACLAGAALAEKADRNQPMNIESDALQHDELKQTSLFTGRVVMTKGTIVLRSERLEVTQDPEGYQSGVAVAAPGTRAFFRQKRDTPPGQPEEFMEGEGETIVYDGRNDTVKFIRRAELRHYRGATLADEVSGSVITYNNLSDHFQVDGPKDSAGAPTPSSKAPRVRAVLVPKAPPAPAPAAPGPAPALRPSPAMADEQ